MLFCRIKPWNYSPKSSALILPELRTSLIFPLRVNTLQGIFQSKSPLGYILMVIPFKNLIVEKRYEA